MEVDYDKRELNHSEIKAKLLIWFYISAIKNDLMNLNILGAFKN